MSIYSAPHWTRDGAEVEIGWFFFFDLVSTVTISWVPICIFLQVWQKDKSFLSCKGRKHSSSWLEWRQDTGIGLVRHTLSLPLPPSLFGGVFLLSSINHHFTVCVHLQTKVSTNQGQISGWGRGGGGSKEEERKRTYTEDGRSLKRKESQLKDSSRKCQCSSCDI